MSMDNQNVRTIIALTLSVLVLVFFQQFMSPPEPKGPIPADKTREDQPAEKEQVRAGEEIEYQEPEPLPEAATEYKERTVEIRNKYYTARMSNHGGTFSYFEINEYLKNDGSPMVLLDRKPGQIRPLSMGRLDDGFSLSRSLFEVQGSDLKLSEKDPSGKVTFKYSGGGWNIVRTYTFYYDSYRIDLEETVQGPEVYQITLGPDFGITNRDDRTEHSGPVFLIGADREPFDLDDLDQPIIFDSPDLKWMALEDKYFFSALVPMDIEEIVETRATRVDDAEILTYKLPSGTNRFMLYAGPKEQDRLEEFGVGLEHIIDYGFFSILSRPIMWLLRNIYKVVGNYGWAIVILTIIIRIPFIPLVSKSQKQMKRMQEMQPKIKAIQEKYKNKKDKESQAKMSQETMELYRKHKLNPIGGCLPMLLQLPVFFALYKVLLIAIELRGAPWLLWITDLSSRDPFYVLPIVMGITMFLQQKLTPTGGDPKMQKMMMAMPLVFTFFFVTFPAGLVLYWLVNNLLSIVQQLFINKFGKSSDPAQTPPASSS